ncbi:MAG: type II secretion system protein [Planctomycetes bacterium]|nr:type II secretion system protein [Planctomycetota bacterium]
MSPCITPGSFCHRRRGGFTVIELCTVVSIIMILAAAVVPAIVPSFRQGQVQSAGDAIIEAWRRARLMARRESDGLDGVMNTAAPIAHYGVAIIQGPNGTEVGLVHATMRASDLGSSLTPCLLRQDPAGPADDALNPPVFRYRFPSQVVVATAMTSVTPLNSGAQSWLVYARYGSGEPITDDVVATGISATAAPTGFGVASSDPSPFPTVVQVKGSAANSKAVSAIAIFHAGFATNERP